MQNLVTSMSATKTYLNNYPGQDVWMSGVRKELSLFANHLRVYLTAIFVCDYL